MKYIKLLCVFCMMFLPVMVFAQGQIKRSSTTRTPPPSSNTVRRSSSTSAAKEKSINKKQSVEQKVFPVRNKVEVSHSEVRDTLVVTKEVLSVKTEVLQAPVSSDKSGTIDGHDYVELGLPSGTLWATCNVGASKPEGYGNYYAWGETATKTVYDWSTYKWTSGSSSTPTKYTGSSSAELELSDDAAYVNWGKNWRMPSQAQFVELVNDDYTTTTWTSINGIYGRKITSKMPGYTGNSIFLPAAGYYSGSSLGSAGSFGYYWSRTLNVSGTSYAMSLYFISSNIYTYDYGRYYGQSIRPVRFSE